LDPTESKAKCYFGVLLRGFFSWLYIYPNLYDDCGGRLAVFHATTDDRDGHIGSVNAPDVFALIRFTLDLAKREGRF
jgi:hypothetical protein